jgi:hypothetical protein
MVRSRILIGLTLVAGLLAGAAPAGAGTTPGWPQFGHDAARTHHQPDETVLTPATVGGLQPLATINGDAAAIAGGRLYTLIGKGRNMELKAVRADNGDFRWRAPRQALYVAAGEGKVVALGPVQDFKNAGPQVDVAVYDENCDGDCAPLFTERVGYDYAWNTPLIYHGWIWFARGSAQFGFGQAVGVPLDCRSDGGVCDVQKIGWALNTQSPNGRIALSAAGNKIFSSLTGAGGRELGAISEACVLGPPRTGFCPGWTGRPPLAGQIGTATIRDGRVYVTVHASDAVTHAETYQLWVYPTVCHPPFGVCQTPLARSAVASTPLGDDIAIAGDRVYVAGGPGAVAYPAACTEGCTPVWSAAVPAGARPGDLLVAGDVLYTHGQSADGDGAAAFDIGCTDTPCAPLWTKPSSGPTAPTGQDGMMLAGGKLWLNGGHHWTLYGLPAAR